MATSRTATSTSDQPRPDRRGFLAWCCAAGVFVTIDHAQAGERPLGLSSDPIVIEWNTVPADGSADCPRLRIRASGLIDSWPVGRGSEQREQRTPEEVRQLASELASSIRGARLSSDAIQQELLDESRRTGLSRVINHAEDSIIRIRTESSWVDVRCHAPLLLVNRFPEADLLREFIRIERRLANLHCIVQCGGRTAAESLCRKANERLQAEHPAAELWTVEDLMMVRSSADGGRFVQFRRHEATEDCWTTCVTESVGRAARVTVIPPPGLPR